MSVLPGAAPAGPDRPGQPPPAPPWNALAIIAFVLAFVVPPGAIACGHIAMAQIRRTGEQGHGLALAAAVIGWVLTGLIALFVAVWLAVVGSILITWIGVLVAAARQG